MNKELYLIRGLPGSGKSTFAKTLAAGLGAAHYEADMYFTNEAGEYDWRPSRIAHAHAWCQAMAKLTMQQGDPLVISNTSISVKEMQPYLDLANQYAYNVASLIVENRRNGQSIHNVPQETIERMRNRFAVQL